MVFMYFLFCFFLHFFLFISSFMFSPFIFELESFSFMSFPFSFLLYFDWISLIFSSFVILISSIIILYSGYYMAGDFFLGRFILILLLFVISMVFLIFGGNFFVIMVGWDGLGLVSFCLVIYYSNKDAMISGIITIIMNRLGDGLILLSIFFFNFFCGFYVDLLLFSSLGGFFLMFSFLTKSAQFPFSAWLPAAMSAPTPISSLVHSSTLVTAGIYLSIRFNFLFVNYFMLNFLMIFSLLTMLLGGGLAVVEMDFSSIVAMSTLSQLGLLFFMISIGFIKLSFFHMISHAFFKSLLFMGTGSLIMDGSQESRESGGILIFSPVVCSVMVVSLFSLLCVPFSIGFYSKDLILDFIFCGNFYFLFYFCFLVGSLLTVVYSLRILLFILPFNFVAGCFFVSSFSFFLFFSLLMGIFLTLFWGSFVYFFILMEDFILVSFPVSMAGFFLIFLGLITIFSKNFFMVFYSLFIWFSGLLSNFYFSDFFFKFDQVWIESGLIWSVDSLVLVSNSFVDFDIKMVWVSFMVVWFVFFVFISLTT